MLNNAGYEAYVVGGAVRSFMLGRDDIHDYDITSSALPEEVHQVFADRRIIDTGIRHGTVTVLEQKHPVEITTYRIEHGYSDHRHPDQVSFTRSLQEDCARRDFTVNALCYHPKEGIRDFFSGTEDLRNHVIRAVGDPMIRFEEDALRILRAVRFAAQLGFVIEEHTELALRSRMESLLYVSQERVTSELVKTVSAPCIKPVFSAYQDMFDLLIPELQEYDEEAKAALPDQLQAAPEDPIIRMAILLNGLHDPARCDQILRRMKFSNADRYAITNLLSLADLPLETRIDMRWAKNKLTVSDETYLAFRCVLDPSLDQSALEDLAARIRKDRDCCTMKQLKVTGKDLTELGFRGSRISMSMNACLSAVIEDRLPNTKEALTAYLRELAGLSD
ncbi:MAG: CCA tRNA nucleotidyltransferase [Solobacterium sp.]|nr:CCA tRNA nucleotidyltransferase [Solobacterium sp.]